MSPSPEQLKRQISEAPHLDGFFQPGEFAYDPDSPWESVRTKMIVHRSGEWLVSTPPATLDAQPTEEPLKTYTGRLGRHILINWSGVGERRGSGLDPQPWAAISRKIRELLDDGSSYRLRLDALRQSLISNHDLDADLIDDTLRMFTSMGLATIYSDLGGLWYAASDQMQEGFARRRYLSSYSDELLAKSRRIDYLIRHTGTVGTYREDLLRNTIRQLLPTRYQANTGFIENSPRQLDIIVWDASRFAPLFRDGEVVVVPLEAVRGVIEVKTTLDTNALDAGLEILHDVFRRDPSAVPIFKGIFAFHRGYDLNRSIAERISLFYNGKQEDGLDRTHGYFYEGITAVCVPIHNFVLESYGMAIKEPEAFPRPLLVELASSSDGDMTTAAFLDKLLCYLDVDRVAKTVRGRMFMPIETHLDENPLVDVFGKGWCPRVAASRLGRSLTLEGAIEYVTRVEKFLVGEFDATEIPNGMDL
ncbi:hypothetical protein ABIA85_009899 [Bradyrhizobium sp. LA6.10]|uniref:DUF6602 domain-containing protein n=1 Tax=Bradyrhizobium sp. LA6.10 TaxID=3156318 RepID=UPI0033913986